MSAVRMKYTIAWFAGCKPKSEDFHDNKSYKQIWGCEVVTTFDYPPNSDSKRKVALLWRMTDYQFKDKLSANEKIQFLSKEKAYRVFELKIKNRRKE